MKVEYFKDIPIIIPNDTFNLEEVGCYVSYNRSTAIYGQDTTALVRMDGVRPTKFLILNGDHFKQYQKLKMYDACVEYFKKHIGQKNFLSENWDEEIIVENGTFHVIKTK